MDPVGIHREALARLQPMLKRVARLQLRNDTWAEDVVSETILAAMERSARFEARATFQSWVVGILKHKVIDLLRRQKREVSIEALIEAGEVDDVDDLFDRAGCRITGPLEWSDPESVLGQQEFLRTLQACLDRLPATAARVFVMREWLELDTQEICDLLSISPAYCNVLIFRARMRLRECIDEQGEVRRDLPERPEHLHERPRVAAVGT